MSRPSTHSDLSESKLRGSAIATFELGQFPVNGKLLAAVGAFITATEQAKLTSSVQYGTTTFYLPPTPDQMDSALCEAQESWDMNRRNYEAALISGTRPEDYTRYGIESWCRSEGHELPWELTSV